MGLVSLGMGWGLGEKVMKEKRAMTFVVARFRDALDGPPIPWVPPCVSPPQFPSRVNMCPPTSLWRGEGRVRLSSVLGRVLIVEPTSLNRGEGLVAEWWFQASCGGKVVARVIVVVEE